MRKRYLLFAWLLMAGIGAPLQNQEAAAGKSGFDQSLPGKWDLRLQTDAGVEKDYTLTNAENDYCRGKMARLIEILKSSPALKSPGGFNVKAITRYLAPEDWYGQHKPPYKNPRVRMEFWASLPELFQQGGKVVEQIEPPYLNVTFNEPNTFIINWELQYQGLWDEQDREIFLQPYSERDIGGITVYERGHTVIIAKKARPPLWISVTREQYLKAQYRHYQKRKKEGSGDPTMVLNFITGRLNAMSPEERRQTAYYCSGAEDPLGLCGPEDEGAFKLVTFNPEYYDRSLPRTAVQLIVIKYGYGGGFTSYEEADEMVFEAAGTNKTLYDLERSLDYQAVARLLD